LQRDFKDPTTVKRFDMLKSVFEQEYFTSRLAKRLKCDEF